jgi:L-ribulose-5-phosphate 4-epimerase
MSLEALRDEVCRANRELAAAGLVSLSFGNASGLDRRSGILLIKPSGIACDAVLPDDLVAVAIADGSVVDGSLRPSSDTPTHVELYRRFPSIGGVVHTHSSYATAFAQARLAIPCLGTTHADHFDGPVPVSRALDDEEVDVDYERATGTVIADTIDALGFDPLAMPAVLVASHGPFTWGSSPAEAALNAQALEIVAALAHRTLTIAGDAAVVGNRLRQRHFQRKHGPGAYYGQPAGSADPNLPIESPRP